MDGRPVPSSMSSRAMPNPISRDRQLRHIGVADDAGTRRALFTLRFVYPFVVACLFKSCRSEGSRIAPIVHQRVIDIMYYSQECREVKYSLAAYPCIFLSIFHEIALGVSS